MSQLLRSLRTRCSTTHTRTRAWTPWSVFQDGSGELPANLTLEVGRSARSRPAIPRNNQIDAQHEERLSEVMPRLPFSNVTEAARCDTITRRQLHHSYVHASETRVSAAHEICGPQCRRRPVSRNPKERHPTFEKHSPRCSRVPFAWSATFSGTFNSLSKVLSTFPSRYLYAIVFGGIFSLRRNLPPKLTLPSQGTRLVGTKSSAGRLLALHGHFTRYTASFQRPLTR